MIDINKIQANPDGSAGTPLAAVDADPLSMPGSYKETEYPLLKAGKIVRFMVTDITIEDAKSEGALQWSDDNGGKAAQNLKITMTTENEERSSTDEVLHKGFGVTTYITMYPGGKRTIANVRSDLLTFGYAVLGKSATISPADVRDRPELFKNKVVDAKVTISEDKSGKYGPRNNFRFVTPGQ